MKYKVFTILMINLGFSVSFASEAKPYSAAPCAPQTGQCQLLWDDFNEDKIFYGNHGQQVHCNQKKSISWGTSAAGQPEVTIKYLGRHVKDNSCPKSPSKDCSKTCYVKTHSTLGKVNGKMIRHGYITSNIKFWAQESKIKNSNNFLWPAFWLVGYDPSGQYGWPQSGEIDIAEHIFNGTYAHLIGHDLPTTATFNPDNMPTLDWGKKALRPDNMVHLWHGMAI